MLQARATIKQKSAIADPHHFPTTMARELLVAIGIPLALLLLAVMALERWNNQLPSWLQHLSRRRGLIWNSGIGLIVGLSALRWLLQR